MLTTSSEDVYREGTIAKIFPVFKTPNGLMKILVDGVVQADIGRFTNSSPFLEAEVFISTPLLEPSNDLDTWRVLHRHYLQNVFI